MSDRIKGTLTPLPGRLSGNLDRVVADHRTLAGRDDYNQHPVHAITGLERELAGKLDIAGGEMTGALSLYGDPTEDSHAATKGYMDRNARPQEATEQDIDEIIYGG